MRCVLIAQSTLPSRDWATRATLQRRMGHTKGTGCRLSARRSFEAQVAPSDSVAQRELHNERILQLRRRFEAC
jgi:hypothetical protein